MTRSSRVLLSLAAVAISFAAADTYVVVLALPEMMTSAGLGVDELQRAAPIVSGFLLGYVAVLPLIGRISDLRGRVPVLVGSLVVFAVGALKAVRRTQAVQRAASAHVTGQVELIKGRVAAIRAEAAERRRNRAAG